MKAIVQHFGGPVMQSWRYPLIEVTKYGRFWTIKVWFFIVIVTHADDRQPLPAYAALANFSRRKWTAQLFTIREKRVTGGGLLAAALAIALLGRRRCK
jgi:hypothetical protein